MAISATKLRSNLYRMIDDVIRKGVPMEVELRGRKVLIVPAEPPNKLAKLVKRPGVLVGDPARLPEVETFDQKNGKKSGVAIPNERVARHTREYHTNQFRLLTGKTALVTHSSPILACLDNRIPYATVHEDVTSRSLSLEIPMLSRRSSRRQFLQQFRSRA